MIEANNEVPSNEHKSIKQQAISGMRWGAVAVVYNAVLQVGSTAVLARLLTPADFGLLGMMTLITSFFGLVADFGASGAIIYEKDIKREILGTLYWSNVIVGVFLYLIIIATSPLTISFFNAPIIGQYLPWLSLTFLIMPVGSQCATLLRKQLRFKLLKVIHMITYTTACIVAVSMALMGKGVASLVWQIVIGASLESIAWLYFGVRDGWRTQLSLDLRSAARQLKFGLYQSGQKSMEFLSENADYLIIGSALGPRALGIYSLGYGLATLPLLKLRPIIGDVAFPAFSRAQGGDEMFRIGYGKLVQFLSAASFPALFGMFVTAPFFVPLLYGQQWIDTIQILQILCLLGIVRTLSPFFKSVIYAKGRADIAFYWDLFGAAASIFACMLGVRWGIAGVAWTMLLCSVAILWTAEFGLRWFCIRMSPAQYLRYIRVPIITSVLMALVVWLTAKALGTGISPLMALFILVPTGVTSYFLLNWLVDRDFVFEVRDIVLRRN